MTESRVTKSLLNAKVSILFYFISIGVAFYSRKIFLEYLGAEFIGLTGTLGNILGYLNIAELGVGTAIAFNLYKPLQEKDRAILLEITSLFRYLYKKIGIFIGIGAILISVFFPLIFAEKEFTYGIIYYAFFSLLFSSLLGYFVNYRMTILIADQKGYLLTQYTETTRIITIIIQMLLLYKTKNLYLYLTINILLSIVNSYIINWKIEKEYPWLKPDKAITTEIKEKYRYIFRSIQQVFIHKIKDTVLLQSDQIFIFAFESLKMVAYYGNYTLVATRVMQIFIVTLNSFYAGVGSLVAEGNKDRIHKVFWELMAIRYFLAGVIVFSMYHLISPFIILWLGNKYLLSQIILILILINVFISETRGVVDMYINAYGQYSDVWAAWTEMGINISVTLVAGYFYGLPGILIGKITSLLVVTVIWKPLYLFRDGMKTTVVEYWKGISKYYIVFALVSIVIGYGLKPRIAIDPASGFYHWILYSFLLCTSFALFYGTLMFFFTKGAKDILFRIPLAQKIYGNTLNK